MTERRNGNSLLASEVELIHQLMTGKSVRAIAHACGKTPQTITGRIKRVMRVSGAKNHFQLGVWARDNGYADSIKTPAGLSVTQALAAQNQTLHGSAA